MRQLNVHAVAHMIVVMVLRERFVRSSHHSRAGNGCAQ
jgi:hypothetical protein